MTRSREMLIAKYEPVSLHGEYAYDWKNNVQRNANTLVIQKVNTMTKMGYHGNTLALMILRLVLLSQKVP